MEEFISKKTEELLVFKRNVFKQSHAKDFISKLFHRNSIREVENELNKCLLHKTMTDQNEISKRKQFISSFLSEYEHIKNTQAQQPAQQQPTEPIQKKIGISAVQPGKETLAGRLVQGGTDDDA